MMRSKLSITLLCILGMGALTAPQANAAAGAVYTLTNSKSGNAVLQFARAADGHLTSAGSFATGGLGTGTGLGNQGAVALDIGNEFLFAVNAGSNSISVFAVHADGLALVEVVNSGGLRPISLAVSRNVLYVLNNGGSAGGSDSIAGFTFDESGHLQKIVARLPLSQPSVGPAQIGFNPEGNVLVVTEKNTNKIDLFLVDDDGVASGPFIEESTAKEPFGFAFGKRDQLFVSDAFQGAARAGAVSSYSLSESGPSLQTINAAVGDNQTAPCWLAVTNDGRFAYATNTGSGTVSGYSISFGGSLHLLNTSGNLASTGTGSAPIDMAITPDTRVLYVLAPGTGEIEGFSISLNGSLTPITAVTGLPSSADGLAVR